MARQNVESPTAPPAIRLLLLGLLPLIAILFYLDGQDYEADLLDFSNTGPNASSIQIFPERILDLNPAGQTRHFGKDNLYEYINGHAEYFIGAGFLGLEVGEYGGDGQSGPQLVVNVYDMGSALNAFGVLVQEAGAQEAVDIGVLGFRGDQGVSFMHGPYYIQLSLFDKSLDPLAAGQAMAKGLTELIPAGELDFNFPDLGTVLSTRYVREYYRGMALFNRVLEREFERDGQTIQAFSITGSKTTTEILVQRLLAFLDNEGMDHSLQTRGGLNLYLVDDPYEGPWFFVPMGGGLIGIYAPFDEALAGALTAFAGTTGK